MPTWQSQPIHVDGIDVQVHVTAEGVTFGKLVDGVYSSDLLLTSEQARDLGYALLTAANRAREG